MGTPTCRHQVVSSRTVPSTGLWPLWGIACLGPSVPELEVEARSRTMLTLLEEKLPALEQLCKLHGVKRLEVVGSTAR